MASSHNSISFLSDTLRNLTYSRFVSAAGLIILLYDHLLTFDEEVKYIWRAKWTGPKVLFLIIRYLVPCGVTIHTFHLSDFSHGHLSNTFCKVWFSIGIFLGVITIAIGNFLVLLRLWSLWERNSRLMRWTLLLFVLTQIANLVCSSIVVKALTESLSYQPIVNLCIIQERDNIALLWAPGIVFEAMVFITVFWNAFDRPRGAGSPVSKALYRDGLSYFIILFSLRISNLTIALVAPLSLLFLGVFFIWSATTVTVTRLILKLRQLGADDLPVAANPTIDDFVGSRGVDSFKLRTSNSIKKISLC